VNETLARRYFPGRSALGQRFGDNPTDVQIVGVVADSLVNDVHEPVPTMAWYPIAQHVEYIRAIMVRAAGKPDAVEAQLRTAVAQAAPGLPVRSIRTLEDQIRSNLVEERLMVQLTTAFGALALLLAAVGLYGVMAYSVARRTSEFGIRMALGARRGKVLGMMLRESALIVAIGLACGIPLMLGAMRLVNSMLFGVSAADPLTVSVATAVLVVVALLAAALPAVRASRVDPMVALRYE
jgi:ABC-type antimicrobial peptide transport system permease subunit